MVQVLCSYYWGCFMVKKMLLLLGLLGFRFISQQAQGLLLLTALCLSHSVQLSSLLVLFAHVLSIRNGGRHASNTDILSCLFL